MKNISVIIPSAGYGKRMNSQIPKQLIEIKNEEIIYYTISRFLNDERIKEIIIPTSEDLKNKIIHICNKFNSSMKFKIILGGEKRQDSVANGLAVLSSNSEIVLVHDAVRPFFAENIINDGIELLKKYDGAIAGVPSINTTKIVVNNLVIETPKRENLYQINTPQLFNKKAILKAYSEAKKINYYGTDDSSLMEKFGGKVAIILDTYDNIKITTKRDLYFAKEIIDGN
ncbi:MAG: 2-C-methyl-D-erythritol 4-phosphate cytidylyltransferase [Candidatus Marinimicrobia bacterium]|nr:2-C-methyl-D-erythritol 4-phosphate cytidylyltransferase [Candidatus Neomarinimicrobiota bacterium]